MVLGKPGAGKTTFLKWLAVKCNLGEFQPHLIPIFISLKDFAKNCSGETELKLFNYINNEQFRYCGIVDESVTETLLNQGRVLILLDGLDEVSEADEDKVIDEIRKFCQRYFKNQFIVTCRIAAAKYRFTEENFTDVEVADFDSHQVETFAKKWFIAVAKNNREEGKATNNRFIEKLNLRENDPIRELAVTPILLNLTCLVFQEKGEFPPKRSKLYEEGLDILLIRWDEYNGIQRDGRYYYLSLSCKKKLLIQVASITFEEGNYFFERDKIQLIIATYLRNLPNMLRPDQTTLQRDSEAVLKSIESQHGLLVERSQRIYSFSHLTFHEYFTAKYFIDSFNPEYLKNSLKQITTKSWREVFLLAADMMQPADKLMHLMKQRTDSLVANDEKLQQFLVWVSQKSLSINPTYKYKPVAVRAFYLAIDRPPDKAFDLAYALDSSLNSDLVNLRRISSEERRRDPFFNRYYKFDPIRDLASDRDLVLVATDPHISLISYLNRALNYTRNIELRCKLKLLKQQLPDTDGRNSEIFKVWWQDHGQSWTAQLKAVMIEHRNIGHDWQFSEYQKQLLKQYYDANKLLVDCLNSGCAVSREVRQEIEDTLLLPIAEIEKRQQPIS
nr:NACHT domain-containing NTPase [Argonema antarcticum]